RWARLLPSRWSTRPENGAAGGGLRPGPPQLVVPGLMVKRRRPSAGRGVGSVMVGVRFSLGPLDSSERSVAGTSCALAGAGARTPSNAAIATTTVAALPFI